MVKTSLRRRPRAPGESAAGQGDAAAISKPGYGDCARSAFERHL